MRKLLVLILLAGLVMGTVSVFAGLVHINGPGIFSGVINETVDLVAFDGVFDTAVAVSRSDIMGSLADDFWGYYNYETFSSENVLPNMIVTVVGVDANPMPENIGAIAVAQEVNPVVGSKRQGIGLILEHN